LWLLPNGLNLLQCQFNSVSTYHQLAFERLIYGALQILFTYLFTCWIDSKSHLEVQNVQKSRVTLTCT